MRKLLCLLFVFSFILITFNVVLARSVAENATSTFVGDLEGNYIAPRGELRTPPPGDGSAEMVINSVNYGSSTANHPFTYGYMTQVVRLPEYDEPLFVYESAPEDDGDDVTATELKFAHWSSEYEFWNTTYLVRPGEDGFPVHTGIRRKCINATSDGVAHIFWGYTTNPFDHNDRASLQMAYGMYDPILATWSYEGDLVAPGERGFSYPMSVTNSNDEVYVTTFRYASPANISHDGEFHFDWKNSAGEWAGLTMVIDEPAPRGESFPHIAVDPVTNDAYIFWSADDDGDGWPDIMVKRWDYDEQTWDPEDIEEGHLAVLGGPTHMYYPYDSPEEVVADTAWCAPIFPLVQVDHDGYIHVVTFANPIDQANLDIGYLSGYFDLGFGGLMYYSRSASPRDMSEWLPPQRVFADTLHEGIAGPGVLSLDDDDNLYLTYATWDTVFFGFYDDGTWGTGSGDGTVVKMAYWDLGNEEPHDWWAEATVDLYIDYGDTALGHTAKIPSPNAAPHVVGGGDIPEESWGLDVVFNVSYAGASTPPTRPHALYYARGPYQPDSLYDYGTSVKSEFQSIAVPMGIHLHQNYPNPFNPTTTIKYDLTTASQTKLAIYNMKGELINTLVDDQMAAGSYQVVWNGTDAAGNLVPSGVYTYRLETDNQVLNRQMILMK